MKSGFSSREESHDLEALTDRSLRSRVSGGSIITHEISCDNVLLCCISLTLGFSLDYATFYRGVY